MDNTPLPLADWFAAYARSFYQADADIQEHIALKEDHTRRVALHCRSLARYLQLPPRTVHLAEWVGMLHDVGRFRQYSEYRTFRDPESIDHALLAVTIIEEERLITGLEPAEQEAVLFAVRQHNVKSLPPAPSALAETLALIIRDADKLDIYPIMAEWLQPPLGVPLSETIIADILAGRRSNYTAMRSRDDHKLIRLGWVYDITYAWTLRRIIDGGYLAEIVRYLPDTPAVQAVWQHIDAYCQTRLAAAAGKA